MTILTARGAGEELKSNLVPDADFAFPNWTHFALAGNAETEDYTIIFSPRPLESPSFLTGEYLHDLTQEEVVEFEKFRAQHRSEPPVLEVRGEGATRRVAVNVPEEAARDGRPVVFEVRIKKQ
jgi:hypothetical protein